MPKVTFWRVEKRSQKQARQFSKRPAYSPKGSLRHLQLSAKAVTARPSSQPGSAKSWSVGPCHCNTPPGPVSLSPPRRSLCRSETAAVGYIVPPNFFEPLVMGFLGRAPLAGCWGRRIYTCQILPTSFSNFDVQAVFVCYFLFPRFATKNTALWRRICWTMSPMPVASAAGGPMRSLD